MTGENEPNITDQSPVDTAPVDAVTEPINPVDAVAEPAGDLSDAAGSDDDILRAAFVEQGHDPDDPEDIQAGDEPEPQADTGGEPSPDATQRGLEVLLERGFGAASAQRLLKADPEMVARLGQEAIDAEAAATADEPAGDGATTDEPEQPADTDTAKPNADLQATVLEILGETFDKEETATIAKAIHAATGGAQAKDIDALVEARVAAANKQLFEIVAQQQQYMARQIARQEADRLSDIHPELKSEEGYAKVEKAAERLLKTGKFQTMAELMEAAATVTFGNARTAEVREYKERVARHRSNGTPAPVGARGPAAMSKDRDDLILEMSLRDGMTENQIKDELARVSRR